MSGGTEGEEGKEVWLAAWNSSDEELIGVVDLKFRGKRGGGVMMAPAARSIDPD